MFNAVILNMLRHYISLVKNYDIQEKTITKFRNIYSNVDVLIMFDVFYMESVL